MASVQEYLQKLRPEYLEQIIRDYCDGSDAYGVDVILAACDALAKQDETLPDAYEAFRCLCRSYLQ